MKEEKSAVQISEVLVKLQKVRQYVTDIGAHCHSYIKKVCDEVNFIAENNPDSQSFIMDVALALKLDPAG